MRLTDQLTDYLHAAFTGLWVHTSEPDEAEREILQHARRQQWQLAVWDIANGLRLPGPPSNSNPAAGSSGDPLAPLRALPALATSDGTALLLLHQFHRFLQNPEVVQTVFTQLVRETVRAVLAEAPALATATERFVSSSQPTRPRWRELDDPDPEPWYDDPEAEWPEADGQSTPPTPGRDRTPVPSRWPRALAVGLQTTLDWLRRSVGRFPVLTARRRIV
jgi:hypothetical protein